LRVYQTNVFDFRTDTLKCSFWLAEKDFVLLRRQRPDIKRAWRNFRLLRRRPLRNRRGERSRTFSSAAAATAYAGVSDLFLNIYIYIHTRRNAKGVADLGGGFIRHCNNRVLRRSIKLIIIYRVRRFLRRAEVHSAYTRFFV